MTSSTDGTDCYVIMRQSIIIIIIIIMIVIIIDKLKPHQNLTEKKEKINETAKIPNVSI